MDLADYLGLLGRREEGRKEYEKLLSEMPSFLFTHVRFARFLEKGGCFEEAAHHYKQVLQNALGEKEELEMAAEELKEHASQHSLELDPWTQETLRRLLK